MSLFFLNFLSTSTAYLNMETLCYETVIALIMFPSLPMFPMHYPCPSIRMIFVIIIIYTFRFLSRMRCFVDIVVYWFKISLVRFPGLIILFTKTTVSVRIILRVTVLHFFRSSICGCFVCLFLRIFVLSAWEMFSTIE